MTVRPTRSAFVAGAMTAALGLASRAGAQTTRPLTTLRVSTAPDEDAVACLWAQQSGIFRRAGLEVVLIASGNGASMTPAVVSGNIDIGKASLVGLIAAHVRGIPLTLVAPAALYDVDAPVTGTLVRADSPLRTARDLNGKTISVQSLKGAMQIATMAWIDQHGGDSASVKFIELPPPAVGLALESGRVDAATLANPSFNELIDTKKARVIGWTSEAVGRRFLLAAYFCTAEFAQRNGDVVARFAKAIQESGAYTNAHRAETVDAIARFTAIKPEQIARMTRVTCGLTLDPAQIQPQIDIAVKYKLIPERFDARELIDPGAAKALAEGANR